MQITNIFLSLVLSLSPSQVVLDEIEAIRYTEGREKATIIAADGTVLYRLSGAERGVAFSESINQYLPGSILIHNHPFEGHPISRQDWVVAVYHNLSQLWAVSPHCEFLLEVDDDRWDANNAKRKANRVHRQLGNIERQIEKQVKDKGLSEASRIFIMTHLVNQEYANRNDEYTYTVSGDKFCMAYIDSLESRVR